MLILALFPFSQLYQKSQIMNIQFLFENGKGSVVDEYGRSEPMGYIVDEEQFCLETLSLIHNI